MTERFNTDDAAALRLDQAVDELLAGRAASSVDAATGALLQRLLAAHRAEPPPTLPARIAAVVRRAEERRWLPARAAAAALGLLMLGQGLGSLLFGRWVARHLGVPFEEHALFEGGVVLVALAGVVLAGALARRWLDLAVWAGAPVGLALAIHGAPELTEFPAGGVLHLGQGAAAIVLGVLWWRARPLRFRIRREERT